MTIGTSMVGLLAWGRAPGQAGSAAGAGLAEWWWWSGAPTSSESESASRTTDGSVAPIVAAEAVDASRTAERSSSRRAAGRVLDGRPASRRPATRPSASGGGCSDEVPAALRLEVADRLLIVRVARRASAIPPRPRHRDRDPSASATFDRTRSVFTRPRRGRKWRRSARLVRHLEVADSVIPWRARAPFISSCITPTSSSTRTSGISIVAFFTA